ncbi:hypothetical protein AB1Y20_012770 [Prymnesium parvum]|uniref:Uncharacterized protein n=2 Tax=Prymnesium parvum TaxID=97485 RepID=A0AB34IMD0_PRYPA
MVKTVGAKDIQKRVRSTKAEMQMRKLKETGTVRGSAAGFNRLFNACGSSSSQSHQCEADNDGPIEKTFFGTREAEAVVALTPTMSGPSCQSASSTTCGAASGTQSVGDADEASHVHEDGPAAQDKLPYAADENVEADGAARGFEYSAGASARDCDPQNIYWEDEDDEALPGEDANSTPHGSKVMRDVCAAVQERLRLELHPRLDKGHNQWLLKLLRKQGWWLSSKVLVDVLKSLGIQVPHCGYLMDVRVWLPDEQFQVQNDLICPQGHEGAKAWGFRESARASLMMIGLTRNWYCITRRYICELCKANYLRSFHSSVDTYMVTNPSTTRAEAEKQLSQRCHRHLISAPPYTFSGTDSDFIAKLPFSRGLSFEGVVPPKSNMGMDRLLLDLMRPLLNSGIRPETFARLLMELHSKNFFRSWLRDEQEQRAQRLATGTSPTRHFHSFADPLEWGGFIPSPSTLQHHYEHFHNSIRDFLDSEVKKRNANFLKLDVSYKEAKFLSRYRGTPLFKGLVTALNDIGECRLQHHVLSESHDQLREPLQSMLRTMAAFGQLPPDVVFTDNIERDASFLLELFPSLAQELFEQEDSNSKMKDQPRVCLQRELEAWLLEGRKLLSTMLHATRDHSSAPTSWIVGTC